MDIRTSKHHAVLFNLDGVVAQSSSANEIAIDPSAIQLIKELRKNKIKTALATHNTLSYPSLEKAGIPLLFDIVIDRNYALQNNLKYSPESDLYLFAAKELGIDPEHTIVIDTPNNFPNFRIINDFSTPPNALESLDTITKLTHGKQIAFFLNLDATLFKSSLDKPLQKLASKHTVVIFSERDLNDLSAAISLKELYYAGSSGLEMAGSKGEHFTINAAKLKKPYLDAAGITLTEKISKIEGARVECKAFSIVIHSEQIAPENRDPLEAILKKTYKYYREHLKLSIEKDIYTFKPNIAWNKGKALRIILELLPHNAEILPIYIVDSTADEDPFKTLCSHGISIAIQDPPCPTAAHYILKNQQQLETLLNNASFG